MNFGIDKLHLFTTDFDISSLKNWNHQPNSKKAGEDEIKQTPLTNIGGEPVNGAKLYANELNYVAEIAHGQMHVKFNPSKFYHPYDLITDSDMISNAFEVISKDIKEKLHTEIDLFHTGIGRIDITAQAEMKHPVPNYDNIIRGSKGMKRAPKTEYPNGFLVGNKTRQVCTYDKGLKNEIDKGARSATSTNFMRIEPRLLNAKAVKMHTPFANACDVLNASDNKFKWTYHKNLTDLIPLHQSQIQFVELSAITDVLRIAKKTKKRQWLQFAMLVLSSGETMPTPTQFEQALIPLVHENIIDRTTQWRSVKDYIKLKHTVQMMRASYQKQSETDYASNHAEFISKFIEPFNVAI